MARTAPHSRPLQQYNRSTIQQYNHPNKNSPVINSTHDLIVGSAVDRPLQSHQSVHKQLLQQDTKSPRPKEDEGAHGITQYLTALCTAWILLTYAGTLSHSTANTTRNKWALTILVFACNIHIVDAAKIQNINHMILQNAAQIKILNCFTAYQQRQHLGGYDTLPHHAMER
jgi:hypothetical protein